MNTPQDSRVTVEPTEEMVKAGAHYLLGGSRWSYEERLGLAREIYTAMQAVSRPSAAASGDDELVQALRDKAAGKRTKLGDTWGDWICRQAADRIEALTRAQPLGGEVADLKQSVIAFAAPWAVQYAQDHGLPNNHLHPEHYDLLERCGARMVDFTRAALTEQKEKRG